jgi:WXG100 family type VII secretion target
MAQIVVTGETLRNGGDKLINASNTFANLMSDLQTNVTGISSSWEGDAHTEFANKVAQLSGTITAYTEVIKQYGQFLIESAEQYTAAETEVQSQTDDITNNLFQ